MADENKDPQAGSGPSVDSTIFFGRLKKFDQSLRRYTKVDGAFLSKGVADANNPYAKSTAVQLYLFGYEMPDVLVFLNMKTNDLTVIASKKKIAFLSPIASHASSGFNVKLVERSSKSDPVPLYKDLLKGWSGELGTLDFKKKEKGDAVTAWYKSLKEEGVKTVDVAKAISLVMAVKEVRSDEGGGLERSDSSIVLTTITNNLPFVASLLTAARSSQDKEFELLKKAGVLTNKVLKNKFIPQLEDTIDKNLVVKHTKMADDVNAVLEDPSKIKLKVPVNDVESVFDPIVQSGGEYSFKVSAQSNEAKLSYDVILITLGARYQSYCASMSRTYMVDPPKKVSATYDILIDVVNACVDVMKPGNKLSDVRKTAIDFLNKKGKSELVAHLPKSLGFSLGLDYRCAQMLLKDENDTLFRENMVFNLSVGFENVPLTEEDVADVSSKAASKSLKKFSVLLGDTYRIKDIDIDNNDSGAEKFTKASSSSDEVIYSINEKESDDDDGDDDSESDSSEDEDAGKKKGKGGSEVNADGKRASSRLREVADGNADVVENAANRVKLQADILKKKNEQRLRELAKKNHKGDDKEETEARELDSYSTGTDMPSNVLPNQVRVDMKNETVILPISGQPVPFHISTIKNVVQPEPDKATYLRINFHAAGAALGKDAPANMVKLVEKYAPHATFIKEMTFRSLEKKNLTDCYRQINELRKRVRQREQKEEQESNLVEQEKLIRLKEGKVPRLSDLTMRPALGKGRKTVGQLEAHQNGLRFRSNKGDSLDIIYKNIKNAFFQPCESEIMVLVHFNLKNPIMVGNKKHENVQFFTEVVEASEQVDASRRSMYDPDEMDEEQRQRQLKKKLNEAFKEFCKKVEATAKSHGPGIEFDIPYRELSFTGTPHKEMVRIQPTVNCLVNLTETPFFVVDFKKVDHVHFERVTYSSKAFDAVFIPKDFIQPVWMITMIDNGDKDAIQDWLTDMEVAYTEGPMNLNWKQLMATVAEDDRFYMDTEEDDVTPKPAGWSFLLMDDEDEGGDGEEEEDDSEFDEQESDESEEVSDEESSFDEEESEESDYDGDEDLEEEGMDWDDMEKEALISDKKRAREQTEQEARMSGKRRK